MAELNAIRYLDNRVKSQDQAVSAACFHCLAYLMNFDKQYADPLLSRLFSQARRIYSFRRF